jgi:hypothetical protein
MKRLEEATVRVKRRRRLYKNTKNSEEVGGMGMC